MQKNIADMLDIILEDGSPTNESVNAAISIVQEIEDAKRTIHSLESKLDILRSKMCAELGLAIRKQMPAMNISVNREGCKVGYKTKHLLLQPDPQKRLWIVKSKDPRFSRRFMSRHSSKTVLSRSYEQLIDAILTHFREHYKTLGEEIEGTGIILVESKVSNLSGLAALVDTRMIFEVQQ